MAKKNNKIIENIIKDINIYSKEIAKNMAIDTRELLYSETKIAIEKFYQDYSPTSYKRHFYNFRNNSFRKYYKNNHGSVYSGGVEISSEEMIDLYRADTDYILDLVYSGQHGNIQALGYGMKNPKTMKPNPLELVENKKEEIVSNINKYIIKAISTSKQSGNYSVLFK